MNSPFAETQLSRREMLRLSAGSLLALGLWPGALRAADTNAGEFRFAVLCDVHFINERCAAFLERVVAQIKAGGQVDFCLLAGDLSDNGTTPELTAVKEAFGKLGVPTYVVPGNHDYALPLSRAPYETVFPGRLNYYFEHKGWNVVALDSTEGRKASKTMIQPETFQRMTDLLPKLDKARPLVMFTHFPLGPNVNQRPTNADRLLELFKEHNLQMVFSGHNHSYNETVAGQTTFLVNKCCSISKPNFDKTKEKGYFLCATKDGKVSREFVEVSTDLPPPAKPASLEKKEN